MPKSVKKKTVPLVAIGGSAGGMEAMIEILENLSPDTGMSYVYIQHLSPEYDSQLDQILGKATRMNVITADHLMEVVPNTVYVIPPNKDIEVIDGVLTLNKRTPRPAAHMPIDKFFASLAERQKTGAIGVVLSGSASDGTFGLRYIRSAGGLTIVQDSSARFQSMPQSALAEDVVDLVLSPQGIAKELERLSSKKDMIRQVMSEEADGEQTASRDEDLMAILMLLKKSVGVDFSHYKVSTIRRRIMRRMLLHKLDAVEDYLAYLKQNTAEAALLYQDLLINVTTFFRDPDALEYLKKTVLPKVISAKKANDPIRMWIPACSTGEEAYTLAMILVELLGDKAGNTPIQIFATDLSELAITKARLGLYTHNELASVSTKQLQRFFTKIDGSYRIIKSIRDLCVFAPHNVFKDPPFSRIDLVSCCNLMIYLDNVLQKKLLSVLHYALNPEGYLVLGKSETISNSGLFTQLEKKFKIFAKKDGATRGLFDLHYKLPDGEFIGTGELATRKKVTPYVSDLEKTVDEILLNKYVPASVVVNGDLEILQFRGSTGLYLEPSPGRASLNLLKMAKPGLPFELRSAIHKSSKNGQPVKRIGLEVKWDDKIQEVCFEVVPLKSENEEKLFLVIFEKGSTNASLTKPDNNISKDTLVKQLQDELMQSKEDMRSIIEEQEASVEELQSANEEIVSSNEELQSINEELETSREELESSNEELMTINAELQMRNEQLAEAHDYTEAIFDTIRKAVIVLDKNLRVKTANKTFYKIFKVREEDTEGVLLYELGNGQWNIPELRTLLQGVIPDGKEFDNHEVVHNFDHIGEKVMCLNALKITQPSQHQNLILLAIDDITEQKQREKNLEEKELWLMSMAEHIPVMIWTSGKDKLRNFFNRQWLTFTGRTVKDEEANGWLEGMHKEDLEKYFKEFNRSFEKREDFELEYRLRNIKGEYVLLKDSGKPVFSPKEEFLGYIGSCILLD